MMKPRTHPKSCLLLVSASIHHDIYRYMAKRMASPTIRSPNSAAWSCPRASMSSAWHARQDAAASGARARASSIARPPPHGRRRSAAAAASSSGASASASAASSNTRALRFLGHLSLLLMADSSCSMALRGDDELGGKVRSSSAWLVGCGVFFHLSASLFYRGV